jgi:hypothetical protein
MAEPFHWRLPSVTASAGCQIKSASRLSEYPPPVTETNADRPGGLYWAGEPVNWGCAWKCDRPLAVDGLEMRLQKSRVAL